MIFFCYNKDGYCDHSDNCNDCDVWVHGNGGKFVPTNADRIRAMSDEELRDFLSKCEFCNICEEYCDNCTYHGDCEKRLLDWLQQPVKENDNA